VRDEVAGQDHQPAGRGDRRVCRPMTWREGSRTLFAPTRQTQPRCVRANDAGHECCSGIVLRCPSDARAPLGRGHACRYTLDMAYCIGRASLGRRMTSGLW
jgi:hypothetical protein